MNENEILFVLSTDVFFDYYPLKSNDIKNIELLPKIYDAIKDNMTNSNNPKLTWLISDEEKILKKFFETRKSFSNNYDEIGMHCLISEKLEIETTSIEKVEVFYSTYLHLYRIYYVLKYPIKLFLSFIF